MQVRGGEAVRMMHPATHRAAGARRVGGSLRSAPVFISCDAIIQVLPTGLVSESVYYVTPGPRRLRLCCYRASTNRPVSRIRASSVALMSFFHPSLSMPAESP
jgi:hypothetical protein